jgi:hypothetical protein
MNGEGDLIEELNRLRIEYVTHSEDFTTEERKERVKTLYRLRERLARSMEVLV